MDGIKTPTNRCRYRDSVTLQNPFFLLPNSAAKMKVYVRAYKKNLTYRNTQLRFILENVSSQEIRIEQEAVFIYPERTERGLEI